MDDAAFEQLWNVERVRIVASLARRFGDLGIAEDAVQEAFVSAQQRWSIDGEPERPGAWLHTVAYRKAIGLLRKQQRTTRVDIDHVELTDPPDRSPLDDDFLGLLLACCHPALDSPARVALTLRHVCGLTVPTIAAGFVISDATLAKRLVRARAKIRAARIPFSLPDDRALRDRIGDIHTVVYMVFTEGHLASSDARTVRNDLCDEAIWLARQVVALRPTDDESKGLLALLLFHHARRASRLDERGHLVRLDEQDRSRWDHDAMAEARHLLADPDVTVLGRYRVEAAIAALHTASDGPDWARIADLYGVLVRLAPSPIAEVNRAVAVGHADGPRAGLTVLEPILASGRLERYPHLHAVHAELLERLDSGDAARRAWQQAARTTASPAQRSVMRARWERLGSAVGGVEVESHPEVGVVTDGADHRERARRRAGEA
jgi:RNA polymerase sigma-70 factor (ECF subfamily)